MDLIKYLNTTKSNICSNESRPIWIVIGNETADLDSVVAALSYSFLKQKILGESIVVVPIINCKSELIKLHSEVVYCLQQHNIPTESLCSVEVLEQLRHNSQNMKICLVDHNWPAPSQFWLAEENYVVQVIDHHSVAKGAAPLLAKCESVILEPVGSCCTLIAERIRSEIEANPSLNIPSEVFHLLYGTILLDTVSLSVDAGRATEKDHIMIAWLEEKLKLSSDKRSELFFNISNAKYTVDGLTVLEILQRDTKFLSYGSKKIAASTMGGINYEELQSRPEFVEDISNFFDSERLSACIMLTTGSGNRGIITKFLEKNLEDKISKEICLPMHDFQLTEKSSHFPNFRVFDQGNKKANRKKILPVIDNFLESYYKNVRSTANQNNLPSSSDDSCGLTVVVEMDVTENQDSKPPLMGGDEDDKSGDRLLVELHTPRNSYSTSPSAEQHEPVASSNYTLPSLNNKRTLDLIEKKRKETFVDETNEDDTDELESSYECPKDNKEDASPRLFTPENSCSDDDDRAEASIDRKMDRLSVKQDHTLPSLNNRHILAQVKEKRLKHSVDVAGDATEDNGSSDQPGTSRDRNAVDDEEAGEQSPFTPSNSFTEDTPLSERLKQEEQEEMISRSSSKHPSSLEERVQQKREKLSQSQSMDYDEGEPVITEEMESTLHQVTDETLHGELMRALLSRWKELGNDIRPETEALIAQVVKEAVLTGWTNKLRRGSGTGEDVQQMRRVTNQVVNNMLESDYLSQYMSSSTLYFEDQIDFNTSVEESSFNLYRRFSGDSTVAINNADLKLLQTLHSQQMFRENNMTSLTEEASELSDNDTTSNGTTLNTEQRKKKLFPDKPIHFDSENLDLNMSCTEISVEDIDGMSTPDFNNLSTPEIDPYFNDPRCTIESASVHTEASNVYEYSVSGGSKCWKVVAPPSSPSPEPATHITPFSEPHVPEYTAEEELEDLHRFKKMYISGVPVRLDMLSIEPYIRVMNHCGFYSDADNNDKITAIIVLAACYLPPKNLPNYEEIMKTLFQYLHHKLITLSTEDYTIVYFQGGATRLQQPAVKWLVNYHQLVDYKLRKNLKHLFIVHPNFWTKTMMFFSKMVVSAKFKSKIVLVKCLKDLALYIPTHYLSIPSHVLIHEQQLN